MNVNCNFPIQVVQFLLNLGLGRILSVEREMTNKYLQLYFSFIYSWWGSWILKKMILFPIMLIFMIFWPNRKKNASVIISELHVACFNVYLCRIFIMYVVCHALKIDILKLQDEFFNGYRHGDRVFYLFVTNGRVLSRCSSWPSFFIVCSLDKGQWYIWRYA